MTALTGQLVRIDAIDFPPEYERKASLVEDDALRRSVEKSGVQQSAVVMPGDNGRYTLVKGGRRLMIAENKGDHTIPVVISVPPTGEDPVQYRNRLRFILTQARQDLRPSQRASLIKQLMSMFGMKQKDVSAYLGVDAGSITNWLAIDKYIPPIVHAIDSEQITLHHARAFDGMSPEGQARVWKQKGKEIAKLSGGQAHRMVRCLYNPKTHVAFYTSAEKTLEKLSRKKAGRRARSRPKLTRNEKDVLARDLTLREVELEDGTAEIKQLKRECAIAAPTLRAIKRAPELWHIVPEATQEEIERFLEVY